jgi:type I restriction enzyme, S subunit
MTHLRQNAPIGWVQKRLGHLVADTQLGGDYPSALADKGTPLVKMINIGRGGIINCEKIERIEDSVEIAPRDYLKHGDLLLNTRNSLDLVGKVALWRNETQGAAFNNNLMRIEFKPSAGLLNEYANLWFNSYDGIRQLRRIAIGTTSVAAIYWRDLASLWVCIPPQHEQRKIADILTTWDEALTQLDALIEAQERRKKALMQQLLTGKKRFPGFKGKWKTVSLGEVLEPIIRPTAKPQGKFLAAGIRSHGKGVFLKHDFIPANIALDELFELKTGDLVVNITFAWEGAAAIVPPEADGALVSHRFPAFGFREGKAARSFFRHYIRTHRFVFDCGLASPGGAGRNRVLSKSAFLDIELPLPPVEEQQKIGDILDTADQQLTLLRTQRSALDEQKRGLMQRLLTGKLRVEI